MALKPVCECSICSHLSELQCGFQVRGREEQDTFLPESAKQLKTVKELKYDHRQVIQQCAECGTYYRLFSEYEFIIGGSNDEQILTRLTDDEAHWSIENPNQAPK